MNSDQKIRQARALRSTLAKKRMQEAESLLRLAANSLIVNGSEDEKVEARILFDIDQSIQKVRERLGLGGED